MDQNKAIRDEVCKAAARLGAGVVKSEQICSLPPAEVYDALMEIGADRFLLTAVGSWGYKSDEDVLEQLKRWNRGLHAFEHVNARKGGKRG